MPERRAINDQPCAPLSMVFSSQYVRPARSMVSAKNNMVSSIFMLKNKPR